METSRVPQGGRLWTKSDGQIAIWAPGPGIVVIRLTGRGYEDFAGPIADEFDVAATKIGKIHFFLDAEHLDKYDSKLRLRATDLFGGNRARVASLHVLFRSSLVAMGVAVANLALDNMITGHSKRSTFKRALDDTLSSLRIVGFSSDVLNA
jgi:hypothetical protein